MINEDECDLIGVTHEDVVFPIVDGACFKILRTWKVIEWCLYEQYGGIVEGINYWEHTQVIKVVNQFGAFSNLLYDNGTKYAFVAMVLCSGSKQ